MFKIFIYIYSLLPILASALLRIDISSHYITSSNLLLGPGHLEHYQYYISHLIIS